MKPEDERFVRSVIARETIRAIANVRQKPPENITENITEGWEGRDSAACWDEYIAMCREAHLQGEPVPSFFLSLRDTAA